MRHEQPPSGDQLFQASFSNSPEEVRAALDQVDQALRALHLPEEERFSVELVLAETLNNIVEHAYDRPDSGQIALRLSADSGGILCQLTDNGRAMPGGALPKGARVDPEVETALLPEGGFGWFLIREIARDLTYERASDMNVLNFRIAVGPVSTQAVAI